MSARRRTILTRDRVCAAALALVDDEGLEALSMRRLAARLSCEAMSLYNYVRDKADLLDAVHAAVLGNLKPETRLDRLRPGFNPDKPKWRRSSATWRARSAPRCSRTPTSCPSSRRSD